MPNVDQCRSKFRNWSQCQSIPINANQYHDFDRHWSALIGIGHWSGESCIYNDNYRFVCLNMNFHAKIARPFCLQYCRAPGRRVSGVKWQSRPIVIVKDPESCNAPMTYRVMYGHFRKSPPNTVIFASRTMLHPWPSCRSVSNIELHSLHTVGFYEPCQNPFATEVARTWYCKSRLWHAIY